MQAALGDNPQLLQMLLQQLYRPTTPAVGGAAAAAGGGAAAGARGGPASEGTPEAGRQGLGPVPVSHVVHAMHKLCQSTSSATECMCLGVAV